MSKDGLFWQKVAKSVGCWEWNASRNKWGYGQTAFGRTSVLAHRYSWELANGPIPKGMCVLHRCDNPGCVNPAHLFLGTNADNVADKVAKGRQARGEKCGARGEKHGSHTHPERRAIGERNGNARLTEAQVAEIRALYSGGATQTDLGRRFGISNVTVSLIVNNKRWKNTK